MKVIVILFGISLLLAGCDRVNNNEGLISDKLNYDYKPVNELDEIPAPAVTPDIVEQNKLFHLLQKKGFEKVKEKSRINEYTYLLFINEKGVVDKTLIVEGMGKKYDNALVNSLKSWKFTPGKVNGKEVKFRTVLKYSPFSDDTLKSFFSLNLSNSFNQEEFASRADEMPQLLEGIENFAKRIQYPESARQTGKEGRVFVKALIDENGNVVGTEIMRGVSAELDEAAIKAVRNTKFKPGKEDGKPVKVQIIMPIMFKLE